MNEIDFFRFAKSFLCRGLVAAVACGAFSIVPAAASLPRPTDCQIDLQGANDEPNQKDLTRFCVELGDGSPYELHTLWNWDNVDIPGGNTNDACTLYDTDGDFLANLAVCVTTRDGGTPATLGAVRLFTCNDSRPDRCAGQIQVPVNTCSGGARDGLACSLESDCDKGGGVCIPDPSIAGTSCTVSQQDTDPFPNGTASPTDTEALCWVDLNDFAMGGSAMLLDACSFPSEQVNSDPSDCIRFQGCVSDSDCNDENACTVDRCVLIPNTNSLACQFDPDEGAACGNPGDGVCDVQDTCNAQGFCDDNVEPETTQCRASAGECDVAEFCDGAGLCPGDGFEPDGTACGNGADSVCDNPDSCVAGVCQPNHEPTTTECRADAGECDVAEFCDGAGLCPGDGFEPDGTACGDGTDGVCDNPDSCVAGACAPNYEPATTECRSDAGECDVAEFCDGAGLCPGDGFEPDGTACGDGTDGVCDNPDSCVAGACAPNYEPATTECRADAGECDVAEFCDGAGLCPGDGFEPDGTACGDGTDSVCDNPDSCVAGTCATNLEPGTTPCRASAGECDVAEFCDGAGLCPGDEFEPDGTACGDGTDGVCDNPDSCVAGACAPNYEPTTTECRADLGECDVAEFCDGAGLCPNDVVLPEGSPCGDDADNSCTAPDTCDADGVCQANNITCGAITDSELCRFDMSSKGICVDGGGVATGDACDVITGVPSCPMGSTCVQEDQFRLLFTPAHQNWVAYKLHASNPGQFYYNLTSTGTPGSSETFSITIPYPFVTQGTNPVHVYDGLNAGTASGSACFTLPAEALDQVRFRITTDDWVNGVVTDPSRNFLTCDAVCGPDGAGLCMFDVTAVYPASGKLYINVHLDYGLKGNELDLNPCDDATVDRYDRDTVPSPWGSYDAYVNTVGDLLDRLALGDCLDYTMGHREIGSTASFADTVQNLNTFKQIAGVYGLCEDMATGGLCAVRTPVSLTRKMTGKVVATGEIDRDGYYALAYQHSGSPEMYTVRVMGGYDLSREVELQAESFAEVSFVTGADGPGGTYRPRRGPADDAGEGAAGR